MPESKIQNLMTELHDLFGNSETSAQQQELMRQLQAHVHNRGEGEPIEPTPAETIELMLDDMEGEHPRTAVVLRELLDTLKNIGV